MNAMYSNGKNKTEKVPNRIFKRLRRMRKTAHLITAYPQIVVCDKKPVVLEDIEFPELPMSQEMKQKRDADYIQNMYNKYNHNFLWFLDVEGTNDDNLLSKELRVSYNLKIDEYDFEYLMKEIEYYKNDEHDDKYFDSLLREIDYCRSIELCN